LCPPISSNGVSNSETVLLCNERHTACDGTMSGVAPLINGCHHTVVYLPQQPVGEVRGIHRPTRGYQVFGLRSRCSRARTGPGFHSGLQRQVTSIQQTARHTGRRLLCVPEASSCDFVSPAAFTRSQSHKASIVFDNLGQRFPFPSKPFWRVWLQSDSQ